MTANFRCEKNVLFYRLVERTGIIYLSGLVRDGSRYSSSLPRGKCFTLIVRFPNQGRQPEDIEIWTHSNETLATVRRRIMARVKSANQTSALTVSAAGNSSLIQSQVVGHQQQQVQQQQQQQQQQSGMKLDLYLNNELIEPSEGFRLVADLPLRDKTVSYSFLC